ncbi:DUF2318 domain-containing protein [Desulfopila sp. IMCC35008]|uniref:DUF2318 domain-containing protein n=1 Tax=Desulfopila sp. IMCC35008 TaxID=2653858 RepID=UPI0013D295AD|nr:DUF2318 domain-containing protein [Desulfopila sp. IMCC35008]
MNRIVLFLLSFFVVFVSPFVFLDDGNAFSLFGSYKSVKAVNGEVHIPVKSVDDGKAHHFKYNGGGVVVKFFVIKSRDGVIRAAFDACDVCFPAGKGYTQDGEFMICNNCGRRFHSTRINVEQGGCNPAPLNRKITGDQLVIRADDILAGGRYFGGA